MKHRRRRLRNPEGCQILAIHRASDKRRLLAFLPSPSDRHPGAGDTRRTEDVHVLLDPRVLRCTFTPRGKSQYLWIGDQIIPRRASFFCHMAIPCFHLEKYKCTSSEQHVFCAQCLSNVEGITVKDISRHMSQNLYVMTVLQVSRAVVLPPLSNLLVHADFVPEKLVPGNGASSAPSAFNTAEAI